MAFSLRKMLSNMNYFKKPSENSESPNKGQKLLYAKSNTTDNKTDLVLTEPDTTSNKYSNSLILPNSVQNYVIKKGSHSDTDVLSVNLETVSKTSKKKLKKLKLNIDKANKMSSELSSYSENDDSSNETENTPKHMLLDCPTAGAFSERIKQFDFNKSFDLFDGMSDDQSSIGDIDIDLFSDATESDDSLITKNKKNVKMCRKVKKFDDIIDKKLIPSTSTESFRDVVLDKNEEERINMLKNYQNKFENIEIVMHKLLSEFQFHIEVSKIFYCRTVQDSEKHQLNSINENISPSGSWNIIMENQDFRLKQNFQNQLINLKESIENFTNSYLSTNLTKKKVTKSFSVKNSEIFNNFKHLRVNTKKKSKHFDFPDIRDAMIILFDESDNTLNNTSSDYEDSELPKCICRCHSHDSTSQTDSGMTSKSDGSISNQSITSSIGNFSLDSTTLTAFSESLDLIVSYNSFQDTSLYGSLLQKPALTRLTFYIQVHGIQLTCESSEKYYESKNIINYCCSFCNTTDIDECDLLRHILSQHHCEKIHFLYKKAYITKCVENGSEIQPSTMLNPMTMYRDDNKIVCFGNAVYACSLCFENKIIGESVLMAHCKEPVHIERRVMLAELLV